MSWLAPIAVIFAAPFLIVLFIDVVRDERDALRKRTSIMSNIAHIAASTLLYIRG